MYILNKYFGDVGICGLWVILLEIFILIICLSLGVGFRLNGGLFVFNYIYFFFLLY